MSSVRKFIRLPIHPILFGLYPVVKFLAFNIKEVEITSSIRIFIIVVVGILVLFLLLRVLVRDWDRAAVMVSIAALLFFSYGQVYSELKNVNVFGVSLGRHRFLIVIFLTLLIVGWMWALKKLKNVDITIGMNVIGIILMVVPVFQIASYEVRFRSSSASTDQFAITQPVIEPAQYPDVYYIITDAYTRDDTIREYYDFDNTTFLEALEDRGFYIAHCGQSNYAWSLMSISSALNMNYIQDIYERQDTNGFTSLIRNNVVRTFFESIGYKSVAFDSGYPPTQWYDAAYYFSRERRNSWDSIFPGGLQEYEALFIRTTVGLVLLDLNTIFQSNFQQMVEESPLRAKYIQTEYNLEKLETIPSIAGPKFIFAHILITHHPYVFGETGDFLQQEVNYTDGYINAVKYTNTRILKLVDKILAESEIPPIIIIQGDHGSEETRESFKRMTILNAYYLPGDGSDQLYPTITPVNTFRIILNVYFNQDLDLLPDLSYYSRWGKLLEFEEVPENWLDCES
jgi:hypothetical protein